MRSAAEEKRASASAAAGGQQKFSTGAAGARESVLEDFVATRRSPNGPGGAGSILRRIFGSESTPGFFTQIVRKWPDAAARAAIAAVALFLFWLTWAHWGDIQLDCGRELYVPYEILRGKLLYKDLFYAFGPLAPYLEAALLYTFGLHFSVLYILGLCTALCYGLVIFEIGETLDSRSVGFSAALIVLIQGFRPSEFNYIFPWSYAGSLGLLFSLFSLLFVIRFILHTKDAYLLSSALFAAIALLSKQEFGAVSFLTLAVTLGWIASSAGSLRSSIRAVLLCLPGVVLCSTIYGWFFWSLTPTVMIADNWIEVPGTYYMRHFGSSWAAAVGLRLSPPEILGMCLNAATVLLCWWLIARAALGSFQRRTLPFVAIVSLGVLVITSAIPFTKELVLFVFIYPRGMFFFGLSYCLYVIFRYKRLKQPKDFARVVLACSALLISFRVLVEVQPIGYSVFYDVPLVLVFVMALARAICYSARPLSIPDAHNLLSALLAMEVISFTFIMLLPHRPARTARLHVAQGAMYLAPNDANVAQQIISFVFEQKQQGRSVAIVPELPFVYALTGTDAPSRWYTIFPGAPSPQQEYGYIADLTRAAPSYLVITNRYTAEYGPRYFGIDYDRRIYHWIEKHYERVGEFGSFRRNGSRELAALLYKRRRFAKTP